MSYVKYRGSPVHGSDFTDAIPRWLSIRLNKLIEIWAIRYLLLKNIAIEVIFIPIF